MKSVFIGMLLAVSITMTSATFAAPTVKKVIFDRDEISKYYNNDVYECIYAGIAEWADKSDETNLVFEFTDSPRNLDILVTFRPRSWFDKMSLHNALGVTAHPNDKDRAVIFLASDIRNCRSLKTTITHEFGHAIGLQHSFSHNSVMYPYSGGSGKVSEYDLQMVRSIYFNTKPETTTATTSVYPSTQETPPPPDSPPPTHTSQGAQLCSEKRYVWCPLTAPSKGYFEEIPCNRNGEHILNYNRCN